MEIKELKKQCRNEVKERLKRLTEGEKAQRSYLSCINVLNTEEFKNAKTVMIYKPMKNECDPTLIESAARETGKKVVYPLCINDCEIKALAPSSESDFKKGAYGIWEPIEEKSEEIKFEDIDLVIVPGIAFDNNLARLGRGGGYYDRFLHKCTKAFKMGFAFYEQIVESVPCEPTDVKLDKLVTNI